LLAICVLGGNIAAQAQSRLPSGQGAQGLPADAQLEEVETPVGQPPAVTSSSDNPYPGTVWIDPLPEDCRTQRQPLLSGGGSFQIDTPPWLGQLQGQMKGHGPLGMTDDPTAVPRDPDRPDYCDVADVGPDTPWETLSGDWWSRDLSVFAGVQGFKGPFDQGTSGNFGFHEGFNYGAPLGIFKWGWQVGAEVVESNLTGDPADGSSSNRNQVFLTGGVFKRVKDWGFQWGVTYDFLHDVYFTKVDEKQIRSDSSFLFPGGVHEIGYFGAYGTGSGNYVLLDRQAQYFVFMESTDVFAAYYRRYFSGGGEGRIWAGFSGRGDGILGGEVRVPMGTSWELANRFNYLIPKQGDGSGGQYTESWGVTIELVYYLGRPARCERYHPYRPFLNVADNTLFMTNTFVP
jgi:hypothetical protein